MNINEYHELEEIDTAENTTWDLLQIHENSGLWWSWTAIFRRSGFSMKLGNT